MYVGHPSDRSRSSSDRGSGSGRSSSMEDAHLTSSSGRPCAFVPWRSSCRAPFATRLARRPRSVTVSAVTATAWGGVEQELRGRVRDSPRLSVRSGQR